jgi:hypothetical protein
MSSIRTSSTTGYSSKDPALFFRGVWWNGWWNRVRGLLVAIIAGIGSILLRRVLALGRILSLVRILSLRRILSWSGVLS